MKVKLLLSIILVSSVSIYLLTGSTPIVTNTSFTDNSVSVPPNPLSNNLDDRFLIGAQNTLSDACCYMLHYDLIGFNYLQQYNGDTIINGKHYPQGPWAYVPNTNSHIDRLFDPVSYYASVVNGNIGYVNTFHNTRVSIMRPKIEWLCFGQRSDYKCNKNHIDPDLWFYSFQTHSSDPDFQDNQYGNGNWVRYCRTSNSTNQGDWVTNPGIVVSRLKANTEQCRATADAAWIGDWECDWLIKPRIRIPQSFVTLEHDETPVCSLKVFSQDGQTILKEIIIKGKYFRDYQTGQYDGRYLEEFNFGSDPVDLTIHGAWGDRWFYAARGNETNPNNEYNKADIQVYWYGNCDMWLDYVRVDNDVADGLLGSGNSSYVIYDQWIMEAARSGYINILAIDPSKFEFNNLPCIKYVENKMKKYSSGGFKIVAAK